MQRCNAGENFSLVNTIQTRQIGVDFQSGYRVEAESMALHFPFAIGAARSYLGGGGGLFRRKNQFG
jgi:hypothetical protein